jgi:AcrR family transcriptional regulator
MTTRSNSSRERILANAEEIILRKGFSATSIEDIIDKAAITKGGFFYHFDGKPGLAISLVERYIQQDDAILSDLQEKASTLSEDPLHRLLIFIRLLANTMLEMETTHPGCLVANFTYESQQTHHQVRDGIKTGLISWRKLILDQLEKIDRKYPPQSDITNNTLADMFTATIEGGILLARNFDDNQLLADQILAYRSVIRMHYGSS